MTTLRIESIFSNFSFYKQNYLNIINDPSQYYQVVESANIHFASFSNERLYLGDLLQLWLSDKWTEHQLKTLAKSHYLLPTQDGVNGQNSLFLFAFKKNSLFKQAYAYAWNTLENKVQEIALNESFPFYCHYLTLSRPKRV